MIQLKEQVTLTEIKDIDTFADKICSQCNLCFRTPHDPSLFCFSKFNKNRLEFIEEFVLAIIHARSKNKSINCFRQLKTFKEVFCDTAKGVCTANKTKCNKRKKKRCFKIFSDQIMVFDLDDTPRDFEKNSKKKKKKKKKEQEAKEKQPTGPIDDEEWWKQNGYDYACGYHSRGTVKDTPTVTVIGKKKFQNKVDKILNEDTDK
jgi:hypothetical protein